MKDVILLGECIHTDRRVHIDDKKNSYLHGCENEDRLVNWNDRETPQEQPCSSPLFFCRSSANFSSYGVENVALYSIEYV